MATEKINKETVEKLAKLTRIEMGEGEKISLTKDLESILGYVSELSQLAPTEASGVIDDNHNNFREDGEAEPAGLYTDKLLAGAPKKENGYVLVKQVIGEKSSQRRPAREAGIK